MGRKREVAPVLTLPTHASGMLPCVVMNGVAVHTVELREGHFAAVVHHKPGMEVGAVAILDREEVDALVLMLTNAMADAERADAGLPMIHAAPTLERQ